MILREALTPEQKMMAAPCRRDPAAWSSIHEGEGAKDAARRLRLAVVACRRCPVLLACRRWLVHQEAAGIMIDGVVAGRYWSATDDRIIGDCVDCGQPMVKSATPRAERLTPAGGVLSMHQGRGLCSRCHQRRRNAGTLAELPRTRKRREGSAA